ncbi:MAG TPA: glycoside hydrolase family 3 N-terminal domain-containing protein [Ktedonobacterales bacterium]|nr:glycoside hydrolase family 3 N-terminal domain-containing protein [Ktedonobacterales bacterium]
MSLGHNKDDVRERAAEISRRVQAGGGSRSRKLLKTARKTTQTQLRAGYVRARHVANDTSWPLRGIGANSEKLARAARRAGYSPRLLGRPPVIGVLLLVILVAVVACNRVVPVGMTGTSSPTAQARIPSTATSSATAAATATKTPKHISKAAAAKFYQDLQVEYAVNTDLSQMSLAEKVGQMIMFETSSQSWDSTMAQNVSDMHAGAIIIYGKNMKTPEQLTQFIADAQAHTKIPMLVTTDEEGGDVDRLGLVKFNDPLPSASYLGSTGNPQLAYDAGTRAAQELAAYGINVDLAPVVDVRTVQGQVEGLRLFGGTPQKVDAYAGQFLLGLQQHGIIGTLKHWPGIGSTTLDPHKTLPTINKSESELESVEFAAFKGLLKDNPGMIMVTHVLLSAIDSSKPASLSSKVVQGILRDELGYQGVVITDNLWMKGVSDRYTLGEAAVLAIIAGNDLIEGPWSAGSMRIVVSALTKAIKSGRIPMARVNEAVSRILKLKVQYGILPLLKIQPSHTLQLPATTGSLASPIADADRPHPAVA